MASPSVSNIACISTTLPNGFQQLKKSIESNVQCRHTSIVKQLLQIQGLILLGDDEKISKRCDALLDGGMIKIIVKLLHSTKNSTIIQNCFQLTKLVTCHANQSHCVTNDYVRMFSWWLKIDCLCGVLDCNMITYNYKYIFTDQALQVCCGPMDKY